MAQSDEMRKRREAAGLTQQQLAHRAGLSLRSIQRYEQGEVPRPAEQRLIDAALPSPSQSGEWDLQSDLRYGDFRILVHRAKARSPV